MCQDNCNCGDGNALWFPPSSKLKFKINDDDSDNLKVETEIVPPMGYKYVGLDDTSTLRISSSGVSISCKSCEDPTSVTGGCGPTMSGQEYICMLQGECKKCGRPTVAAKIAGTDVTFETGGFVNFTQSVSFITVDTKDKDCIPASFPAMFEVEEIQTQLAEFKTRVYDGQPDPVMITGDGYQVAPNGYKIAAINVFGRVAWLPVPDSSVNDRIICSAAAKCNCSTHTDSMPSSTNNCLPHQEPNNSFATCDSNCAGTCTLKVGKFTPLGDFEPVYTSKVYVL